jgi:hypothetical protein
VFIGYTTLSLTPGRGGRDNGDPDDDRRTPKRLFAVYAKN